MVRTQLYLPEDLYKALKKKAAVKNMNFASYTRFYLEQAVMDDKVKKSKEKTLLQKYPFLKFAGMIKVSKSELVDGALDKAIYGF